MPPFVLDAAAPSKLVSADVAAPSIHNSQPWHFRFDPAAPRSSPNNWTPTPC
ncbi:hypothetical protein OG196_01885 [Kitasatospora purpeofusca]|uniref:hypothetical protein n=1 Tax=Kitasatospora purpeofusca TaxID=67352 RepID=UPI002E0E366D|nr:hypothetical protein OG715_01330 [Kitasatospora purpeofusca]WSR37932.1 hypothetical protein OG196_01885 [Kitasatospora purpeofusca]